MPSHWEWSLGPLNRAMAQIRLEQKSRVEWVHAVWGGLSRGDPMSVHGGAVQEVGHKEQARGVFSKQRLQ